MTAKEKLEKIVDKITKGTTPETVTVRDILEWFGVSRRGNNVNRSIRNELEKLGLGTSPDFESAWIYGQIKFILTGSDEDISETISSYRIDSLTSANKKPIYVKPDSPLSEAITIMLTKDFSQLPVMTTERDVKGAITWKSIGSRLALNDKKGNSVKDFMVEALIIKSDSSLFEAIKEIEKNEYVLVQAKDKIICGIVTASDLSLQFKDLASPFIFVGEIENHLRKILHGKFSEDELKEAKNPGDPNRVVEGLADLTLGEYARLLEKPEKWEKLKISIDRTEFIKQLSKIREIRNDVMHFDPQGIDDEAIKELQSFMKFLYEVRRCSNI